jgi:glutamate dehydrogenase (NAD(P)+)
VPVTREAEELLAQRGVLCLPDFVTNSGGVLGGTMDFAGFSRSAIVAFVDEHFAKQVSLLIDKARKEGVSIREAAEEIAAERRKRLKGSTEKRSLWKGVFSLALDLYRNGLIPELLVRPLALRYFRKRIEGNF